MTTGTLQFCRPELLFGLLNLACHFDPIQPNALSGTISPTNGVQKSELPCSPALINQSGREAIICGLPYHPSRLDAIVLADLSPARFSETFSRCNRCSASRLNAY